MFKLKQSVEGSLREVYIESIGSFSMEDLVIGEKKILERRPAWPETKSMDAEQFDFSLLMKILQRISSLNN